MLSFFVLYPEWESNPHSKEHEFESCASTNSAIRALKSFEVKNHFITFLECANISKVSNFNRKILKNLLSESDFIFTFAPNYTYAGLTNYITTN